ncbi:hypothetical protein PVK06_037135 [Gossypium arboreum]|uniref:Cell division cycle 20.2, cofactor of APC complex-like n=1 Tax=Gossypium arboreum TaxID=29729 RepID=A0ABR0MWG1_GOSAR|nr:hypothetical protein PVK06_037135 [Gossypium arboreum]
MDQEELERKVHYHQITYSAKRPESVRLEVKVAEHVLTGHKVAIKNLDLTKIKTKAMEEKVRREINISRLFMHPHIIRLYEVIETTTDIFMVTEYAESGELFDYIVLKRRLHEDEARKLFQQAGVYTIPSHLSSGARDLIARILVVDPTKRLTIPEIRQHPWFQPYLPRYLAVFPPDTTQQAQKIDDDIFQHVVRMGFERNHLVESLCNRVQNEGTVVYHLLLDNRFGLSSDYLGGAEFQYRGHSIPNHDGRCLSSFSNLKGQSRCPLQEQLLQRKNSKENMDRFIPNRSAMDFDYAHYMLTDGRKIKENQTACSPAREAYRKQLAETLNMNRTRILAFKNKPPAPVELFPSEHSTASAHPTKSLKPRRHIPQSSERTLDAPDLVDDFYLNLLDWGSSNVLAIALGNTVYLWDASDSSTSELVTVDDENGPVTSVNWAPDGRHIAIGLNNSEVQLWDSTANRQLRTLRGCHRSRVGSMAWNNHILTTGGMDGQIVNNDVRIRSHVVETYRGHQQEVCGLKWSASGQQLASGGNDNVVHIWDRSMASSSSPTQWLHRLEEHTSAVKALAWCPFQSNLLATGGGGGDRTIKFWNTHTGACLNSVDTGSQVCSLLWSKNERELLSSHGFTQNQLTLWKYPSMVKMAELMGHTSRVLYMAQSPDGCTVASAAGDETLRFWNVFGVPEVAKTAPKVNREPFSQLNRIR